MKLIFSFIFSFRRRIQADVALQMIADDDSNIPVTSDDENLSDEDDEVEFDIDQQTLDSADNSDDDGDDESTTSNNG